MVEAPAGPVARAIRIAFLALLAPALLVVVSPQLAAAWVAADVLTAFIVPVVIGALAMAGLAALVSWRTAVLWLACAVLGLAQWAAAPAAPFAPRGAPGDVRILLINVHAGNRDTPQVERLISRERPDLVALLEANPAFAGMAQRLEADFPFHIYVEATDWPEGPQLRRLLLMSRTPLARTQDVKGSLWLNMVTADWTPPGGRPQVRLHLVHMPRPWPFLPVPVQPETGRELAQHVGRPEGPTLMMGDFNATSTSVLLKRLSARTGLSPVRTLWGSYHAGLVPQARMAIDHVFAGQGIEVVRRRTLGRVGSDHSPVAIDLRLAPPAPEGQRRGRSSSR